MALEMDLTPSKLLRPPRHINSGTLRIKSTDPNGTVVLYYPIESSLLYSLCFNRFVT
jgi:hypothetical protein